ncbi:MAG TPA: porin PorA family protein [Abditibacterium sp.]
MRNSNSPAPKVMPPPRRPLLRIFPLALGLCLLATALRFWLAPHLTRLPADYAEEIRYAARCRYRDTPDGTWQQFDLVVRRVDQTLVFSADDAIIQGDVHWTTETGKVTYESAGVYGIDRRTRSNLSGYGNMQRGGQFLFPKHVQRTTYQLWDPFYTGPRTATFVEETTLNGLPVYVFDCRAKNIDDTTGYSFLVNVPERHHAYSAGGGKMWIEPISGIMVDMEDVGKSYFGTPKTGKWVSDFYFWHARYTPETKAAQWQRAVTARRRILALELWFPIALLLSGLLSLALGVSGAFTTSNRASTGSKP